MDKLITTVNEYPWTSFFVFLILYILFSVILKICKVVFLNINPDKE